MRQGWESKKLGEVAKIGAGNSAPQDKSLFTNGVYPFFRTSDIGKIRIGGVSTALDLLNDQGIKKLKLYPKGTILLPKSGASTFLNHRVILDVDGFVSSHLATVVCDEDLLDKRFALYYLIGIKAQDLIQDHSYPSLKLSDIKEIPIPIPPLEEQKQILAKLDQCFEAIDKARANAAKNLENAKELFQSKLNEIFSQKGEDWVEKKLGDVCEKIQDGAHHSPKVQYDEKASGRYLYITSKNIRNNYLKLDKVSYVDEEFHNTIYHRCTPEFGDILLTKDGANTGNITLNTLREPFSLLSSVCLIKTNRDLLLPNFLKFYIQSPIGFKKITGSMTGTAIKRIVLKTIKKSTMPMPDINTQKQLVAQLNIIYGKTQSLEAKYKTELNSLEELKKSILQKAFEGELV